MYGECGEKGFSFYCEWGWVVMCNVRSSVFNLVVGYAFLFNLLIISLLFCAIMRGGIYFFHNIPLYPFNSTKLLIKGHFVGGGWDPDPLCKDRVGSYRFRAKWGRRRGDVVVGGLQACKEGGRPYTVSEGGRST